MNELFNENRMNASDIVKAKQNKVLYKSLYNPTVFQSTVFSTINTVSSLIYPTFQNSYTSTVNTAYNYVCNPTFISYELANNVNNGQYACGAKSVSYMQWKNLNNTTVYAYSTMYSTIISPSIPIPSSFSVTSTTILTGPTPVVQPFIEFYQGTNFASKCNQCNTTLGSCQCN